MNPELSYGEKPAGAEAAPQSFFSRLIGVYFSPGETFAGMALAPRALTPIIVFVLFSVISVAAATSRMPMDKINEDRLQQQIASGRITEAQAEQQRVAMKRFEPYMKFVIPIGIAIWAV